MHSAIEHRITRDLLRRRELGVRDMSPRIVERLITTAAATAVLLILGSYAQELLWVTLAGSTVLTLGTRSG
jgi:hypothetical protein